ncbi:lipoyl domain-containing protein [Leptospira sp. GIMC2001]|uniref:lipoyl domain-containing protein n=1 Tax=Leptospira sp. GIMC2001 TaxID=1513297 RepID=UPI00234A1CBD|nr:lipoyl domain-containing protein [Leptospira sp. GIMC2001]WCL50603.1 lipoyl domain-containing protein [Leptospira sp. GIMC2001]
MEKTIFELITPDLGDTDKIELVKWYCKVGESIEEGQEVLELVTDKAAFPMESPRNGILSKVLFHEGDVVKRGDILGVLTI